MSDEEHRNRRARRVDRLFSRQMSDLSDHILSDLGFARDRISAGLRGHLMRLGG